MIWAVLAGFAATPAVGGVARKLERTLARWSTVGWITLAAGCVVAAVAVASVDPVAAKFVYAAALLAIVAAAVVDVAEQRLPNVLTLSSGGFALVALTSISVVTGAGSPWRALAGGAILGAWILLGALVVRDGYGLGDVKLAVTCGTLVGWLSWQALAIDVLVTQVAIAISLAHAKSRGRPRAPLGAAFAVGILIAVIVARAAPGSILS